MLSDIFGQAIEAMKHNGRRTMITVVGMAWGIATVVLLLAYGAGFGQAFENIFAQWGTNMIGVFPGRTSEQAGGDKAGMQVRLTQEDVERIQETVPGILRVAPTVDKTVLVQNRDCTVLAGTLRESHRSSSRSRRWIWPRAVPSQRPTCSNGRTLPSLGQRRRQNFFPVCMRLGRRYV